MKCVGGSHLYGTDTENSDTDILGVYLPEPADILLQRIKPAVTVVKNTASDVDETYYSFDKFVHMLAQGQLVALDILFNNQHLIDPDPRWTAFVNLYSKKLLNKKTASFIGYCKSQAHKYCVKGDSRIKALKRLRDCIIDACDDGSVYPSIKILSEGYKDRISLIVESSPYLEFTEHDNCQYVKVCGKEYNTSAHVRGLLDLIETLLERYGYRAQEASTNNNVDWKALSHAVRVGYQAIELLETGEIKFPLQKREYIRNVKLGLCKYKDVVAKLDYLLEQIEEISIHSRLPENVEPEVDNVIFKMYQGVVNQPHTISTIKFKMRRQEKLSTEEVNYLIHNDVFMEGLELQYVQAVPHNYYGVFELTVKVFKVKVEDFKDKLYQVEYFRAVSSDHIDTGYEQIAKEIRKTE